jgi:flagellar M-ring protein FliF
MAAQNPFEQIKTFFTRYTLQQKLALAGSAALVLVLLWVLVYFVNRVEYQTLYADLDPQEAQGIVAKLQELKVPYELGTDGRTVKVASDKIAEVRIQMASQGLPESGRIGFEIFDRTNFGLTNFQEQVNYQRALEGELARSIMTLAEVEAARVHLVLAKESLFQSSDDQTKASVILKLKNGRSLSAAAASGIVNMVASAVKGLTAEKVVLIDYRGKILSRNGGAESGLSSQQLDTRQKLETELSGKIVQILEPAVGQGKVRPQVSATMNFQQVEETVEQYDPQGSVVRSQQRQEEHQPKGEGKVGGIPGPRNTPSANPANTAPTAAAPATAPDANASNNSNENLLKRNETVNYEVSKAVRHVVNPVGKIDRVSVAVLIDNHTKTTTGADGKEQTTQEPRSPEEMKKYKDLIAAAIGFNPDRGDQLTLENISFQGETELLEKPGFIEKQGPMIMTGLRYLIIPVIFIILYLLFLRPVQKTMFRWAPAGASAPVRSLPRQLTSGGLQTPMTVKQLEAQLNGTPIKDDYAGTPEREFLPLPTPTKMDLIRKRVVEQAQTDPETVARLVRVWLADEKNR